MLVKDLPDNFCTVDGTRHYRFTNRIPHGLEGSCVSLGELGTVKRANNADRYLVTLETNVGNRFEGHQFILQEGDWIAIKIEDIRYVDGKTDQSCTTYMMTNRQMSKLARTFTDKKPKITEQWSVS
jgi:hypothetical protein